MDISPLKRHAVHVSSRASLGKRKIQQSSEVLAKQVANILNVTTDEVKIETSVDKISPEIESKAADLDHLISCMKQKIVQEIVQEPKNYKFFLSFQIPGR